MLNEIKVHSEMVKQEDSKLEISRLRRRIGELEHMAAKLYEDKINGAINVIPSLS